MKTLADVVALIQEMKTMPGLAEHTASLEGPRTRGSTTECALSDLDGSLPLEPLDSPYILKGCRAYRSHSMKLGGRLGARPLLDVLKEGYTSAVKIRQGVGKHGPELYLDYPIKDAYMPNVNFFTVIVGEHEGREII